MLDERNSKFPMELIKIIDQKCERFFFLMSSKKQTIELFLFQGFSLQGEGSFISFYLFPAILRFN